MIISPINVAEICNVSDRVGSLEKGKDADIAIFSGHPMDIFTRTLHTIKMMKEYRNKE